MSDNPVTITRDQLELIPFPAPSAEMLALNKLLDDMGGDICRAFMIKAEDFPPPIENVLEDFAATINRGVMERIMGWCNCKGSSHDPECPWWVQ